MFTQDEYNVSIQRTRELYAKINILSYDFQLIDEISGYVIGTPSFTNAEGSDFRRTANITLEASKSIFDITRGNYIWLDRYIQIYMGIKDIKSGEIIYTNMGIYLIDNPNRVYNATENSLNFQCIDLMAQFTGDRNGVMSGMGETLIPAGTNVREAFMSLFEYAQQDMGITMKPPLIKECDFDVPNDILLSAGATYYEVFNELVNINPLYQIYFDVDGVFHYELIPTVSNNDMILADDYLWNKTEIGHNAITDFSNVKNVVEVYGHTWNPTIVVGENLIQYAGSKTIIINLSSQYGQMTSIDEIKKSLKNNVISLSMPSYIIAEIDAVRFNLGLNRIFPSENQPPLRIVNDNNHYVKDIKELSDTNYYIVKYDYKRPEDDGKIIYKSGLQAHYVVEDNNYQSPFNVNAGIGRIRIVLSEGNYENLFSNIQCRAVAQKELYLRTQLYDSITLTTLPIYWLDVNNLVKYRDNIYLVKSISTSDTQSISLMRVYE